MVRLRTASTYAGDLKLHNNCSAGMHRLVTKVSQALHGITVKFVDVTDLEKVRRAFLFDCDLPSKFKVQFLLLRAGFSPFASIDRVTACSLPPQVKAALTPATRMVHMETPSNPMMRITDIRALSQLLRARGVLLSIDSTMMSPVSTSPWLMQTNELSLAELPNLTSCLSIALVVGPCRGPQVLQRPLSLGADVVVHSATKFFGGVRGQA